MARAARKVAVGRWVPHDSSGRTTDRSCHLDDGKEAFLEHSHRMLFCLRQRTLVKGQFYG